MFNPTQINVKFIYLLTKLNDNFLHFILVHFENAFTISFDIFAT